MSPAATSNVTQLWMVDSSYSTSKSPIRADDHPKLRQFFKPLQSKYWEFVNINKLGKHSYKYERDDLIQNLQRFRFVCPKRGLPIQTALAASIKLETTFALEVATGSEADTPPSSRQRELQLAGSGSSDFDTVETEQQERVFVQQQAIDLLETTLVDALDVDGSARTAFNQAELIECQYHYETVDMVEDYSPVFRENYGLSPDDHPRCWELIKQMRTGNTAIRVDNWWSIMSDHFNETLSADASGSGFF